MNRVLSWPWMAGYLLSTLIRAHVRKTAAEHRRCGCSSRARDVMTWAEEWWK